MWALVTVIAAVASVIRSAPEWHYCYECSGQSALCRESVYDGLYLSKTACSSTCFLRYEGETIYRGCFDGWLGGMVDHEYQGCRTQEYLGEKVEWCFCKGYDKDPCNGASRDAISKLGPPKEDNKASQHNVSDASNVSQASKKENNITASTKIEFLKEIPKPPESISNFEYHGEGGLENDGKTDAFQITYEDDWTNTQLDDPRVVRFEEDSVDERDEFDCVTCHDSSPYCQNKVEQTTYLTLRKCLTKCFVRIQDSKIYRGCFDGWKGTSVTSDYEGCRGQHYMNAPVEWCFCSTPRCNTASVEELSGVSRQPSGSSPVLINDNKHLPESEQKAEIVHSPEMGYMGEEESKTRGTVVGMCRGHQDGVYGDPYDCSRFVHCFNGFTYRRLCPPGTIWNTERRNCDYPHSSNVPCTSRRWTLY